MYMKRRKPDSMEVQQMKIQAREEKASKQVPPCRFLLCIISPLMPTVAIKHPVPDRVKPSFVIFDIRTLWRSGWVFDAQAERQSAQMSKITNDGLTRSGTGWFVAVPIWQQFVSKGPNVPQ